MILDAAAVTTVPIAVFTVLEDEVIVVPMFRIIPSIASSITMTLVSTMFAIDSTSVSMAELATEMFDVMEPLTEDNMLTTALLMVSPQL